MKKITLVLAVLALVSCKFDQTGNKNILPESESVEIHDAQATVAHEEKMDEAPHAEEESLLDKAGNYVYNVGDLFDIELPDGQVLHVGKNSTENKLFTMLKDAGYEVSSNKSEGWVTLDRVYFNTGSDGLTTTSKAQLDNIVAILKAFPDAEVKFGGYTDNTGSQDINQPLSEGRAKSVMIDVVKGGIDTERLAAEGYGSEHPICPANDTEVCKAQNRRVDVRITKK